MSDEEYTYAGTEGDPHDKPLTVREASGGSTYAVVVAEVFGDGSRSDMHFTEGQARALRDELDQILDD